MSGLFGNLSIALRALLAQQGALEVSSNNIANVNTPGFSRQRPVFRQEPPLVLGPLTLGMGVSLEKVQSIRDRVLELRIHQETQQESGLESFLGAMQQVEALFNEAEGSGLESVLTRFFNSLLQLSTEPSSLPLRQGVLTAGENLSQAFRRSVRSLLTLQTSLDRGVVQSVQEINQLTREIAELNRQVSALEGVGQEAGTFVDRRDLLIRELSRRIDVTAIDAGDGSLTLTTSTGTALLVGNQSIPLETQNDSATGFQHIFSGGVDLTMTIHAGQLGGLLEVRDQKIPAILADLDHLAASLANAFNAQHVSGFDLSGAAAGNFFVPPPAGGAGAAANFAVALTDPAQIAASSDGSPGSNGNLVILAALRDQAVVSGQRAADFYAGLVFRLGNDVANAKAEAEAESLVLRQLENQRSNLSAVSLDEEAANLLRYQRAFEAAARVVSVIDDLTETAINLGRS